MRTFQLFVLALTLFATHLKAQYLESENIAHQHAEFISNVNSSWSHDFTPTIGISNWMVVNRYYGEALVGIRFHLPNIGAEKASLDLQIGEETNNHPLRGRMAFFAGSSRGHLLVVTEDGGSGVWVLEDANFNLHPRFGVGLREESHVGLGPRFQTQIGKITVWGVPAAWQRGTSQRNAAFGIQIIP